MSLKLLLVSVSGTLADSDNRLNAKILNDLALLTRELASAGVRVALWSTRDWTYKSGRLVDHFAELAGVEVLAHGPAVDGSPARRRGDAVLPVLQRYNVTRHETVLLGGTNEDMRAAVNSKLLHIRADWYGQQSTYGFSVASVSELARFCFLFALRQHPVYWHVSNPPLAVWSCGPFSTMRPDFAIFGADARSAKHGNGHPDFWFYLTISTLYFAGILEGVKYMCRYPGHGEGNAETAWDEVLVRLCKCFRISYYHDLIIRHTTADKSQPIRAHNRKFSTQLNTIMLNARPRMNLSPQPNKTPLSVRGSTVVLVDDFLTSGRSLEAGRTYLCSAGADVRCFTWLKTIRTSYHQLDPEVSVNPYTQNVFHEEPTHREHGYESGIVDARAPDEITRILRLYLQWKWPQP